MTPPEPSLTRPSGAVDTVDDTIAAIASARGPAPRGIIRISGPQALSAVASVVPERDSESFARGRPSFVKRSFVVVPRVDQVPAWLYVWPGTRTYTRQPTVEIHTVGSSVILDAIIERLCAAGCRLARPGEFTLRAFLAGRLDLAQAEAVLGVIDAHDAQQLDLALQMLAGGVSHPLQAIRSELLDLCADLEAGLDFVDEGISFVPKHVLLARLEHARDVIAGTLEQIRTREVPVEVPIVALAGRPNAGKSSLMNALTKSSVSIVAPTAGTTRDYVSQRLEFRGQVLELVDTAGLHDVDERGTQQRDTIDNNAQQMTQHLLDRATLKLLCLDASQNLGDWERRLWEKVKHDQSWLVVANKCDLPLSNTLELPWIPTSSLTGVGISDLLGAITQRLAERHDGSGGAVSVTSRCANALRLAMDATTNAHDLARSDDHAEELIAAELRLALNSLADVVGAVYTNDLLDRIFSRFCIGK